MARWHSEANFKNIKSEKRILTGFNFIAISKLGIVKNPLQTLL